MPTCTATSSPIPRRPTPSSPISPSRPGRSATSDACRSHPSKARSSPCSPPRSAPGGRSRSGPSPATPRCASPVVWHRLGCDLSEEWTSLACRYWARAGLADRIELRLGPAADTLASLPEEPVVDLAFLDANKPGYRAYYELLLPRLRPGGLLLADNVLQHGRVLDPDDHAESTEAIRAFNDRVAADDRVDVVVLPIADGLTLARKR